MPHPSLLFSLILIWMACQAAPSSGQGPDRPTRDTLVQVMRQQRHLYVVYGSEARGLREALTSIVGEPSGWLDFTLVADTAATDSLLAAHPHLLIGTPETHRWLRRWQDSLPVRFEADALHFADHRIAQPDEVLSLALYPSPANAFMPLGLLTAAHEQALIDWLQGARGPSWDSPLSQRWGYQLMAGQQRKLLGMFTEDWQPGGQPHWDFSREPQPDLSTAHLRIYQQETALDRDSLRRLAQAIERRLAGLRTWLDRPDLPLSPIALHLYPSAERMGLMQNVQEQAYARPKRNEVHRLVNAHYARRQLISHEELRPFLRQALGEPETAILETGLAVALTPGWMREGHRYWAGRLAAGDGHLSLAQLLDPEQYETNSPLVQAAMAGLLVDCLVDTWGKAEFLARYARWEPGSADVKQLAPTWQRYLRQVAEEQPQQRWPHQPLTYYRGMTLAHEGYNVYNGYGSDSARKALRRLDRLHVNSIALVPYTGARSTSSPRPYPVWQRAGTENDAATVGSFIHAEALGMQTLLKPQIWFAGGWPGEVEMDSEAEWAEFFRYYRQWIMHYALLAAVHEMDAFCAGVEFAQATQSHPDQWRQLIRDLRQVYAGPITYAANWGAEAENLAFGDELDFIGINCYYPLSEETQPSKAALTASFAQIKQKLAVVSQRHQRPVVLTELGFRCVTAPWRNPHTGPQGRSPDPEAQRLAYEVVLSGLDGADWCQGMFWWKWPSYLGYAQRNQTSFTPCHRPAAQVLARWYGQWGE